MDLDAGKAAGDAAPSVTGSGRERRANFGQHRDQEKAEGVKAAVVRLAFSPLCMQFPSAKTFERDLCIFIPVN